MNSQVVQPAETTLCRHQINAITASTPPTFGIGERDRGTAPAFSIEQGKSAVRNWETGELIPDFTGIAYDYMAKMFILLGMHNGERSFEYLFSSNYRDAQNEADIRMKKHAEAFAKLAS